MHAAPFLRARCGHAIFSTTRPDDSRRCSSCSASTARCCWRAATDSHAARVSCRWQIPPAAAARRAQGNASPVRSQPRPPNQTPHPRRHHPSTPSRVRASSHPGSLRRVRPRDPRQERALPHCQPPQSLQRQVGDPAQRLLGRPHRQHPAPFSLSPDASSPRLCSAIIAILYAIGNAAALTKSKSSGMRTHVAACTATRSANPPW